VADRYRRRVVLAARGYAACGALEDDIHHVRVTVRHDGARITEAVGEAVRLPWSTCPGSEAGIASLVGTELAAATRGLKSAYRADTHCTHMFDLAQLVIAQAARGDGAVDYLATVDVPDVGEMHAEITRDGVTVITWDVERYTQPAMPTDDAITEAAFVLRRAVWLAPISSMRFDEYETVGPTGLPPGTCWTAQPERIEVAFRHRGSQRHYGAAPDGPDAMLAGFPEYRAATLGEGLG
jgi:hypothetical protein